MNEYIIINKTAIQQRIEELEEAHSLSKEATFAQSILELSIVQYKAILSQSTPLIPEIEKAFDEGLQSDMNYFIRLPSHEKLKQDYTSNLKLNI
jgi:hypothetical protein